MKDPLLTFPRRSNISTKAGSNRRQNVILKMPKRKRGEPSLEENLAKWEKELVRGLKTAKGFERQRLSKRFREADTEKTARLEREILVLKV